MAKDQKRVTLVFDADTAKAKQSINDLYGTLEKLSRMNTTNSGLSLTKDIQEATRAATQLKVSLEDAINVNTGKLDLNKFNQSLQKSRMSLSDYQRILTSCGPAGQQAFTQLAKSVVTADTSVIRLSDRVRSLGVTLANTVKWQMSSSIVHGVAGALSSAYGYAKDLNESLNNIRIVTGYSVDKMKDFAKEANKAAQALSTTTTNYSDAALIFYQQGLSDSAVKERTDAVVKLANVTGESAEQISNYMTAIWNNFAKAGDNLEYYADVLTKLGAATASSSDEIAGGLEKFSAIADTIGLSYEYAASALATITAKTRQSEDVVGTSLKTIFARIQGLSLGETLEDGVNLNKYSEALQKVGISVLDANGELKNMDYILDELGKRWESLSKAEQTALAQTVGGVRQYNQLISLMDNWDDFKINVDLALDSEGTLDEQLAIYEQSWKAASQRLKASFEDMYDSLINDEAFIELTDFFSTLVHSITTTIDSIGGLKGVMLILGSVLMKVFSPQIGQTLDNIGLKIQRIATGTNSGMAQMKQQATQMLGQTYEGSGTLGGGAQSIAAVNMGEVNNTYLQYAEKLAPFQKRIAESLLQQQNALNESVIAQGELVKLKEKEFKTESERTSRAAQTRQGGVKDNPTHEDWIRYEGQDKETSEYIKQTAIKNKVKSVRNTKDNSITVKGDESAIKLQTAIVKEYNEALSQSKMIRSGFVEQFQGIFDTESASMETLATNLTEITTKTQDGTFNFEEFKNTVNSASFETISSELDKGVNSFEAMEKALQKQGKSMEQAFGKVGAKAIQQYGERIKQAKKAQDQMASSTKTIENLEKKLQKTRTAAGKQKIEEKIAAEKEKLTAATQKYTTAVQGNKDALQQNGEAGQTLRQIFATAEAQMTSLSDKAALARNALLALGYSDDQLKALETACEQMNVDFTELIRLLGAASGGAKSFEGNLNSLATSSNTLGQTLSKIGSAASQVAMGINAISGLGEIWSNDDISVGEKFTSTLMNMAMVLPLVGTAMDALSMITKMHTLNKLAETGATEATIAAKMKEIGVTQAETVSLWGKAAAWIAAHPLLAGIGLAAAAAGIALLVVMTKKEEQNTQAVKEAAEAAKEKAEAEKEEVQANKELLDSYNDAYKTYKETGENKQDLIDKSLELAKAYNIERGAIYALTGDYKKLNEEIIKKRKEELQHLKDTNNSGKEAANKVLVDKLREGDGWLNSSGKYTGAFDNGMSNADESIAYKAFNQDSYKYLTRSGGEIAFSVDSASPEQMYEYYLELQRFAEEQRKIAEETGVSLGGSEIYQDILQELAEGKETFEELQQYFNDNAELQLELSSYETSITDNDGTKKLLNDIENLEDYAKFLEEYKRNYALALGYEENSTDPIMAEQWTKATEAAEDYLTSLDQFSDLSTWHEGFEGLANNEDIDKIKTYFNELSDEDKTLFWTLGINEYTSMDNIKTYMQNAQDYLDFNKLYAEIAIKEEALDLWKNNNFTELKKLFDEDKYGTTTWDDFIKMDAGSAEAFLKEAAGQKNQNLIDLFTNYSQTKKGNKETLEGNVGDKTIERNTKEGLYNTAKDTYDSLSSAYKSYELHPDTGSPMQHGVGYWIDSQRGSYYDDYLMKHYNFAENAQEKYMVNDIWGSDEKGFSASKYVQDEIVARANNSALLEGTNFATYMQDFGNYITASESDTLEYSDFDTWLQEGAGAELAQMMADAKNTELGQNAYTAEYMKQTLQYIVGNAGGYNANSANDQNLGVDALLALMDTAMADTVSQAETEKNSAHTDYVKAETALTTAQENLSNYLINGSQQEHEMRQQVEKRLMDMVGESKSLNDILAIKDILRENAIEINYKTLAQGLINVASQYDNCANAIANYEEALLSNDFTQVEAAEDALTASIYLGEAAAQYGLDVETLQYQAQLLSDTMDPMAASVLAVQNQLMNQGIEEVINNLDSWKASIAEGDELSQDYAKSLSEMSKAIRKLVGVSDDYEVSADFMTKAFEDGTTALELMEEAANGSEEAIQRLGIELAKSNISNLQADASWFEQKEEELTNGDALQGLDSKDYADTIAAYHEDWQTEFDTTKQVVLNGLDSLQAALNSKSLKIDGDAYEALGGDEWVNSLNEMAMATGMSVEQMQNMLNSMGLQAEVVTDTKKTKVKVPWYRTQESYDPETGIRESHVVEQGLDEVDGEIEVAQINTGDSIGDKPKITYIGNGNISPSKTSSSGGGGKSTKSKKSDVVDRYKEINDQLDTVARHLDQANKEADKLWGPARLKKMKEIGEQIDKQNKLLKQKAELAKDYLKNGIKSDQQELINAVKTNVSDLTGIDLSNIFDEDGNFTSYHEVYDKLWAELDKAQQAGDEAAVEKIQEKIDNVDAALALYDETRQVAQDAINSFKDGILTKQQHVLDEMAGELELRITINDKDLERLDYYLSKYDEDIYNMEERLLAMVGGTGATLGDNQLTNYLENLAEYQNQYNKLVEAYTTIDPSTGDRKINQAQFIEQLQQLQSNLYTELGNVKALDDAMKTYYSDTLAAANEELSKHTEKMERHVMVLDHYSTLMDLLGYSKDFEKMGTVLKGQVELSENAAKVSKANYDMLFTQAEVRRKEWEDAQNNSALSEDQKNMIKENWEAAEAAASEAQDQMLSDAEAWAESLTSLLENELAKLADILNESLSGDFDSLDQLSLAMERKNSLQEEYLTTTNKIYETDKMMRTAQQEIDKTTNSVAKKRLKQFIEETEQLQSQNKLSQHELDIQQAKYDLLLAEIALEEAQNAKSTVRLQRDAEGNFGYVYTADQNKVADAEQKLADAQNSLYNIGLEGANDYAQKYAETVAEMNDELVALSEARMNGEIATDEELRRRQEELTQHYYEKLQNFSHLYQVSLDADSRVEADAWSTQFGSMTYETEKWMNAVKQYAGDVAQAFKDYDADLEEIELYTIGKDASEVASQTEAIVRNSDELTEAITKEGGVIDALEAEINTVQDLVMEYIMLKDEIDAAIASAEEFAEKAGNTVETESNDSEDDDLGTTNPEDAYNVDDETEPEQPTTPGSESKELAIGDKVTVKSTATNYSDRSGNVGMADFVPGSTYNVKRIYGDEVLIGKGPGEVTGWVWRKDLEGFDTGGYTGEWGGSYGKLAMLHQKELVLNPGDTANFLASIEVLERILQVLDLHSASSQLGGLLYSPGMRDTGNQTIEQNIHIDAQFPNATDRFEIEEAFKSMADLASQYANRK